MKKHELFINDLCSQLITCGIKFDPKAIIEDDHERITLKHKPHEDMSKLISNTLAIKGIQFRFMPLAECDTWIFNKECVWHIVSYKDKMYIQWNSISFEVKKK